MKIKTSPRIPIAWVLLESSRAEQGILQKPLRAVGKRDGILEKRGREQAGVNYSPMTFPAQQPSVSL